MPELGNFFSETRIFVERERSPKSLVAVPPEFRVRSRGVADRWLMDTELYTVHCI
jgi:hypothetical protein